MNQPSRVLVTGATGFVGQRLVGLLLSLGYKVSVSLRGNGREAPTGSLRTVVVGSQDATADWGRALDGVRTVIHLAGRAHVMREPASVSTRANFTVNRDGTMRLAEQALNSSVERFVFVSTAKVFGEATPPGNIYRVGDPESPVGPYAESKLDAERRLFELFSHSDIGLTIVRPPLVYGPGAKGNFPRLMRLASRPLPLPFANISNLRSMVHVDNLASFLERAAHAPTAIGTTLLPGDDRDVSTPELITTARSILGVPDRQFALPPRALALLSRAPIGGALISRLTESFRIDTQHSQQLLSWTPPYTFDSGLKHALQQDTIV